MDVLVCVKRVPTVGGAITVSADGLSCIVTMNKVHSVTATDEG